ncbi:amidohydrolase family protein, partial [Candidatus Bathyarchaeota archaeon]|nr:amidohydrolase family protein [Candidatus Bathyarchaeota archaeon]
MIADLALVNGNIITMNSVQQTAEAIAIKKDKIINVGTNEEINHYIGKNTNIINLQGKTIVPGFIDAHIHVSDFGKFLTWLDLKDVNSIKEMQKRIKKRANKSPNERWIVGNGWNQANFIEQRYPNRLDLDETAPDHPVILYHKLGRMCVVNSKALELADVTKRTSTPLGGKIGKNPETGELSGILSETATDLVWNKIPEPNEEELGESSELAIDKIIQSGVTSVHWIVSSLKEISIIRRLAVENKLPLRVFIIAPANILDQLYDAGISQNSDNNNLKILGIKVFVDGSLAARTAALNEPYDDDKKTKGELLYSQQNLDTLVKKIHKTKFNLVLHAMGDKA